MLFSERLKGFQAAHPCQSITVDGAQYRYVLAGNEGAQTLVLLNGGMNTLAMWMDYVDDLARDFRVLLFDYPQELRTNQALVTGMHAFFKKLRVEKPRVHRRQRRQLLRLLYHRQPRINERRQASTPVSVSFCHYVIPRCATRRVSAAAASAP